MPEIKCIIVEDEPLAADILTDYILQVPFLKLTGTFKNAMLATEFLHQNEVQLIFLDIHLPKLKGMAFLRTLTHPPAVIVTTAYHQYAVEGFELNVADYLMKPIEFERFLVAVNKVKSAGIARVSSTIVEEPKDSIFLTIQKKKVRIHFSDIVYVESQKKYIKIVTTSGEFFSMMGTHDIEALLPQQLFRRIHRSYIISLKKIKSFTAEEVEVSGAVIPVGRAYKDVLENL